MLKFRVEGQKLTWENPDEVVVAGTKKYLECYFEFDGDAWSGFEYIEAFFKNGRDKPIRMLLSANRIWKEDGLCLTAGDWSVYLCATTYNAEKEEIERQITSSSVSIRVLAHGQFEDAQNSFESPEIANQYIAAMQVFEEAREEAENERAKAENARNVFEEYNPDKTYVKGNKVAYEGSSYVLTADEALGTNPTDTGSWLCIAEKGDKGEQGQQGIKGDKGASGGKIFSYALGYGKDVEVGSYKMAIPPFELIENGIDYNDIIVDTDGGCIFQYVASIGDDEAMLPAEGLHCIANPNGEKGDKGDKGEQGIPGNDAVLPNGIMKYIRSVKELPASASTGDVYKISETIFEGNTIVVPNDDGFQDAFNESNGAESMAIYNDSALYYAFMSAWEYVTATGNPLITVKVDGKPHDIEMVDFKESMGKEDDQVLKYCGLAVYRQADEGTKLWYSFFGEWERAEFFIPEDYWQSVDEYRKVLFAKGECVVFKDGTWQRLSGDEAERVGLELKASNTISERERNRIWDGFEYNADVDLSNVSNEDFKTKAEEAGVGGGTSDAMVFKGVVSELPKTANEGEVYKITNTTTSNLYVRHNGEWVEISKDGVTKSEMESYIEETLLGGEW